MWLIADMLTHGLPRLLSRLRRGERPARHVTDRGRETILAGPVLAAASWGVVPEPGRRTVWVSAGRPEPEPEPDSEPAPAPPATEASAVPAPPVLPGVIRALGVAERVEAAAGTLAGHLRILSVAETRSRRLRRGEDPSLVVSCFSDASSARLVPDEVQEPVTA